MFKSYHSAAAKRGRRGSNYALALVLAVAPAITFACGGDDEDVPPSDGGAGTGGEPSAGTAGQGGEPSAGMAGQGGTSAGQGGEPSAGTAGQGGSNAGTGGTAAGTGGQPEGGAPAAGAGGQGGTAAECILNNPDLDEETIPNPTGTTTLTADTTWILDGTTYVEDGDVLTIEPCTTIKGVAATLGTLVVSRGGQIMAEGEADQPILFTSSADPGERAPADWGGVILLGRAQNWEGDNVNIEGLVEDPANQYGGTEDDDDSGTMRYVRIEYSGVEIGEGNEINGLTLGSVGSGTTLEYIMVSNTLDDGYEFFGGTVSPNHLISNNAGDDMFDCDQGFRGELTNIFGRQVTPLSSDPNGFEWDSSTADLEPVTNAKATNATLCGTGELGDATRRGMVLRENLTGAIDDAVVIGFDTGVDTRDDVGTVDDPSVTIMNSIFFDNTNVVGDPEEDDNDNGFDEDVWFMMGDNNEVTDPGFSVDDCLENPPADAVTESGVGAFADDADWMQGLWVDWAED